MTGQAQTMDPMRLALVGVPNSGKTALFNRLTGSRQKVANYAGVTVERKEGSFVGPGRHRAYKVLDLPGAYSLTPTTLDEAVTRDFLLGRLANEPAPEFVVCVVDATNLRLNLRLVLELRRPRRADGRRAQHERPGGPAAATGMDRALPGSGTRRAGRRDRRRDPRRRPGVARSTRETAAPRAAAGGGVA